MWRPQGKFSSMEKWFSNYYWCYCIILEKVDSQHYSIIWKELFNSDSSSRWHVQIYLFCCKHCSWYNLTVHLRSLLLLFAIIMRFMIFRVIEYITGAIQYTSAKVVLHYEVQKTSMMTLTLINFYEHIQMIQA